MGDGAELAERRAEREREEEGATVEGDAVELEPTPEELEREHEARAVGTTMATRHVPAVIPAAGTLPMERTVEELVERREKVKKAMELAMEEGQHYGRIPGVSKPSLLKPGAETLCTLFLLDPEYDVTERYEPDGHLSVLASCTLYHTPTGARVASGPGSCTTRETKYAIRKTERTCPECGEPFLFKSKREPEWYCWRAKGGCGATFQLDDQRVTDQETGSRPSTLQELADTYNTILKMAAKRALVAAVLNATGTSDIFTQDVEDAAPRVVTETRQENAGKPDPVPRSWAKVNELAAPYGPGLGWNVWLAQMSQAVFDEANSKKLSAEQRKVLLQKAASAIIKLRETYPPDAFPPPGRSEVAEAFKAPAGGTVLAGPAWRMGPGADEEKLPSFEEWSEARAAEGDGY